MPLPDQVDAVCSDGSACGLMAIAQVLRERGVAGTFFLNVYESRAWGEPVLADIAIRLQKAGQDVALHTHPQWAYDPSRNAMYQYSVDEQTAIIRDGVRLLAAWTGQPVVAHRAGDYTADERTIEALNRNGVRVDSSLFRGHPRSRLTQIGLPGNVPSQLGSLNEIPVTTYLREERLKYVAGFFAPNRSIRKIDPDWFVDEAEARAAIDGLIDADCPFIVVFLHSFSLLEPGGAKVALPNRHAREIFLAILNHVRDKGLNVVTMREVANLPPAALKYRQSDFIPEVLVETNLHRYIWHRVRNLEAASIEIAVAIAALGVGLALALAVAGERRRNAVQQSAGDPENDS